MEPILKKTEPILKIENMNISFQQKGEKKDIVKNGAFEVYPGEFVLILGENGSGKTSIFRSIVEGVTKNSRNTRDMYFNGKKVGSEFKLDDFRRSIGYARQEDDPDRFFSRTVERYVRDYVAIQLTSAELPSAIKEVYKALDCKKYADEKLMSRKLSKCSGGEKRMVTLLSALSRSKSALFILDEPINNLDAHHARLLNNYLADLKQRPNPPGILVITHCHMFQCVDRAYQLKNCQLVEMPNYQPKSCYGECISGGRYTEEE